MVLIQIVKTDETLSATDKIAKQDIKKGLFEAAKFLYGVNAEEIKDVPVYNPAVQTYKLTNEDGSLTARGKTIIAHTPAGRFAEPDELLGTIHYLISDASSFVTGVLSVVDGGFDAFSI